MANDSGEIVVGANGTVWVAANATNAPDDIATAMHADFKDVGFISEDGVAFSDSKEINSVGAWQSFYTVRRIIASRDASVSFVMRQWNDKNLPLAFGGGAVTEPTPGEYVYTPPSPEELDERCLVVEWADGDKNYRLVIGKGMVTDAVETTLARTGPADLPITFSVTPESGDDPFLFYTDDPAFEAA